MARTDPFALPPGGIPTEPLPDVRRAPGLVHPELRPGLPIEPAIADYYGASLGPPRRAEAADLPSRPTAVVADSERANLADLIEQRFGVKTEARRSTVGLTVGTAAAVLLRTNPKRLAAIVVNLGSAAVFVSPFPDVSSTAGIRLAPNGGTLSIIWDEDFDLTGDEWFAIADAAATAVFFTEVVAR